MNSYLLQVVMIGMTLHCRSAWYEPDSAQGYGVPELRGGGGGTKESELKRKENNLTPVRKELTVPCCSYRKTYNEARPSNIDVIGIRGQMEAQDIDIGNKGCIDRIFKAMSGWCTSRDRRPLTPIVPMRVMRTNSYYPGRSSKDVGFGKP